jgi:peroxiredoxin
MKSDASHKKSKPATKRNLSFRLGIIALGLCVIWFITSLSGESNLLKVGTPAPEWTLGEPNARTRTLSLSQLKGKVVVFDFWSLNCPPCMQMVAELDAVSRKFSDKEVAIVGVSAWGESKHDVFRLKRGRSLDYHLLVGTGDVVRAYKVDSLPTLYIIDKKGEIARTHQGFWSRTAIAEAVAEVLDDES